MANDGTTPLIEEEVIAASLSTTGKSPKDLENTVLLGRGKSHLNHQGNKFFQGETDGQSHRKCTTMIVPVFCF
jgi:hypothetical protein